MCQCGFIVFTAIAVLLKYGQVLGAATRTPGAISREKCQESANLTTFSIPIGNSEYLRLKECTIEKGLGLIRNDNVALQQEFPHMALLGYDSEKGTKWMCAGSLISDRFVLTVAHCIASISGPVKYVRVGVNKISDQQYRQDFNVIEGIVHPDYTNTSYYNDIGLIKLHASARLSPQVRPACLYTESEDPTRGIISGWPRDISTEPKEDLLRINMDVVDRKICDEKIAPNRRLQDGISRESQLCVGFSENNTTVCENGSGWPLQVYSVGKEFYCTFQIFGITSFGSLCTTSDNPEVHTRVANYIKWIEDIVWPEEAAAPISEITYPQ